MTPVAQDFEQRTRPIIGEGDETTGEWKLRYCTEISLNALELAILCACWYVRKANVAEASTFIPPELFQFAEDLLIPPARQRERIEIKHPLPILERPIQILRKEEFLKNPDQHSQFSEDQEKNYLRRCCEETINTGLPRLYRMKETQGFQLFSSLIWTFYAAKIESAEIEEEPTETVPEEIAHAHNVYRENFNLPHHRLVAARQLNNEARKVLHAIRDATASLLPRQEKERWLAKTEQAINNDIFRTKQTLLKGYISKEDADQLRELDEAEKRVEENARKKKLRRESDFDDGEAGEIPDERWDA